MATVDSDLYLAAKELKRPKSSEYWADYFKGLYTRQEILEAFWRLVGRGKMYLTDDRKLGTR